MTRSRRMLFKIGITVIVFVAVYLYFALKLEKDQGDIKLDSEKSGVTPDNVEIVKESQVNEEQSGGSVPKIENSQRHEEDVVVSAKETATDLRQTSIHAENVADHNSVRSSGKGSIDLKNKTWKSDKWRSSLHVAVVACGDRAEESMVMLKSAVILSNKSLVFHIFADLQLQKYFIDQLEFWPEEFKDKVTYHIYNITFPSENEAEWKKLFKLCASQRLFIPSLLTDVDSLLYVDTDVLFLRPLEDIWQFFTSFNSTHLAALAPEHEDKATGWYNRFARHPYYGPLGVNSGVMLMNLTRLRSSEWLESMLKYHKEYKYMITWGDQDLINIYFYFHPDELYIYSCDWNYRPDHCMYMSVCKEAEHHGISVLHGCRRVWHEDKQPAFKAIYKTFKEHRMGDSIEYGLLKKMKQNLAQTAHTSCGKLQHIFIKQLENYVKTKS